MIEYTIGDVNVTFTGPFQPLVHVNLPNSWKGIVMMSVTSLLRNFDCLTSNTFKLLIVLFCTVEFPAFDLKDTRKNALLK